MRITLIMGLAAAGLACGKSKSVEVSGQIAPQGLPPLSANAPHGAGQAAADRGSVTLSGKVLERVDAPPYSYLRIATPAGEAWAAVNQTDAAVGTAVTVTGTTMAGFKSKTLDRTFDRIIFGAIGGRASAPHPVGEPANAHTMSAVASQVQVPPAEGTGATTIAALFARKATLADQQVAVRGKVVKINAGIMGKTWLHLQDGSGSSETGDHDITVTTTDPASLDEVVTVRAPVHLDRDFGAGYRYAVILENARLER